MKKFIKSFFNKGEEELSEEVSGKYMPDLNDPVEERFTYFFTENGGKFLYCENKPECVNFFLKIIEENNWEDAEQIKSHKVNDLPLNFIVVAKISQITDTLSEGLNRIKNKYPNNLPTNITSIKNFKNLEKENTNFLTYGSSAKNLYLLLLDRLLQFHTLFFLFFLCFTMKFFST